MRIPIFTSKIPDFTRFSLLLWHIHVIKCSIIRKPLFIFWKSKQSSHELYERIDINVFSNGCKLSMQFQLKSIYRYWYIDTDIDIDIDIHIVFSFTLNFFSSIGRFWNRIRNIIHTFKEENACLALFHYLCWSRLPMFRLVILFANKNHQHFFYLMLK
jgi:hypothetical protein